MDKKLFLLISLFFLSFLIFTSILVFNKPLTQLARAKEDLTPSIDKSKILAYPLYSIAANGQAESLISVFINSASEKPLANKVVSLNTSLGELTPQSAATDANGKAVFRIRSTSPGVANIEASVDSLKLRQTVSVKFE